MPTIVTRNSKGSLLTPTEGDDQVAASTRYVNGAVTVSALHNRETLECDGTFTVTLPDAATLQSSLQESSSYGDIGFEVHIVNAGSGVVTVALTTAADTLKGVANGTILLGPNKSASITPNTNGGVADGYLLTSSANTTQTLFVDSHSIAGGTGTFYVEMLGGAGAAAITSAEQIVPVTGYIKQMYCGAKSSNNLDADLAITLIKNGTATALTATITAGSTATFTDLVNEVSVAAGDTLAWRLADIATTGAANNISLSAIFEY